MPRFNVDVKAFVNLSVEAHDEESARIAADAFVEEGMVVTKAQIEGYNAELDDPVGKVVPDTYALSVDGYSDVEEGEA